MGMGIGTEAESQAQWQQHDGRSIFVSVDVGWKITGKYSIRRILPVPSACGFSGLGQMSKLEQLRLVWSQFNWFVFYANEDYTLSAWRRLPLILCGGQNATHSHSHSHSHSPALLTRSCSPRVEWLHVASDFCFISPRDAEASKTFTTSCAGELRLGFHRLLIRL